MKTWIFIVWICIQVQDPCPSGMVGCAVYHSHYECNDHESFLDRDSAMIFLKEQDDFFAPKQELDSMTLEEYIKKY
jgi:hypothetical protein